MRNISTYVKKEMESLGIEPRSSSLKPRISEKGIKIDFQLVIQESN